MRLDQALVLRKLCESRQEAQECIDIGAVLVNGVLTHKQTKKILDSDILEVTKRRNFVSRGGEKLLGVLMDVFGTEDAIKANLETKRAIDIGSSTGGFTDCLLQHTISHVDAVDVGTNQLHKKLLGLPTVTLYENTDIRNFTGKEYDIIVADLSFIPLQSVIEKIISFGKKSSWYFLLIKPQFEVGKGNTKKGIVKDLSLVEGVLTNYTSLVLSHTGEQPKIYPSKLQGGDGNQEYFIVWQQQN